MEAILDLMSVCETENQKQVCLMVSKSNSYSDAARKLNVNESTVRRCIKRLKNKFGKTNKNDTDIDIETKSTSTLYDKDGNVITKWVKKDNSKSQIKTLVKQYINEYSKKLPKYVSTKNTISKVENKLVVYPIADVHLGMLSWFSETGCNYNTKTADELVRTTVKTIIDRSPSCEECLICNLGDFLHVDNAVNQTERSGNVLDCDGRYGKIMQISIKLMRYIIEYALQKHKKVSVICCKGNHDDLGQLWLCAALSNIYENEKRLNIISNFTPRIYYKYGNTLIGCTHGSDIKDKDLPIIMATEKKEDWGNTQFHYWYCGHWHQNKVIEIGDCKVEAFNAVCAKDAWSNSKGFLSARNLKAIFIDPKKGETERYTLNI